MFLCGIVALFAFAIYNWWREPDRFLTNLVPLLMALAFGILSMEYAVPFFCAREFVKKNRHKLGPATHSIGPDGVSSKSTHGDGKTKWTAYFRIRETRRFFLLYTQSNFAQILPKRCFDNPADVEKYRQVLSTYYKGKLQLLP